jgi:hypothetical protein
VVVPDFIPYFLLSIFLLSEIEEQGRTLGKKSDKTDKTMSSPGGCLL